MKQRMTAFLLTLFLIAGMLPSAFAVDVTEEEIPEVTVQAEEQDGGTTQEEPAEEDDAALQPDEELEVAAEPYTSTIGVGTEDTAKLSASATYENSFGEQLSDDADATQAYQEMESAFSSGNYTCSDKKVTFSYTSTSKQEVGTTASSQPTEDELSEMLTEYRLSVRNAYTAYYRDHPATFYIAQEITQVENLVAEKQSDGQYAWTVSSVTLKIQCLFSSQSALDTAQQRYSNALDVAVQKAEMGETRYEQIQLAHDYLCNATTYRSGGTFQYSSYGALVSGGCVCEGYSLAFKAICDELNIPAVCVSGIGAPTGDKDAGESHMWNYVQMADDKWYAVDTTWDDTDDKGYTDFFLVGGDSTAEHFSDLTFSEMHIKSGYFYSDKTTKNYAYPRLHRTEYEKITAVTLQETADADIGYTVTLTAQTTPEDSAAALSWSSSDTTVAKAAKGGKVTGVAEGTAVITAKADDGPEASCTVTVHRQELESVALSETTDVDIGHTVALEVTITPEHATEQELTWVSADRSIATVDGDGVVTGVAEGTTQVTATAPNGKSATTTVTVHYVTVTGIALKADGESVQSLHLYKNETKTLTAVTSPDTASAFRVSWSTSNRGVATVAADGTVTAVDTGKATITATADGVSASCTINVTPKLRTPTLTSATNAVGGVRIRWKTVSGATGYCVCRKSSGSWAKTQIAAVGGNSSTSYTDSSVVSGKEYKYTVYALYNGVKSSDFNTEGLSVYYVKSPALSTIANVTDGLRVTWKKVSGVNGYYVYRKGASDTNWTKIAAIDSGSIISYTDTTVKNHYTYKYTVRAYTANGRSAYHSDGISLRRVSTPKLTSAKNSSAGAIMVRWERVGYVTGYQVQYTSTGSFDNGTTVTITDQDTLKKKLTGLKKKQYTVRVRAYKTRSGQRIYSAWSVRQSVTVTQ